METTPVGNYQPLPYCLPGLFTHLGSSPFEADWLGRCAAGITCWCFLVLAVALLWNGSPLSLVGLLVASSPMALFVAASLTPSGLEIAAGVAFAASLCRVWRDDAVRGPVWLVLGAAGATLALSRSSASARVVRPGAPVAQSCCSWPGPWRIKHGRAPTARNCRSIAQHS
jgi:hypothetical protein